MSFVVLETGLKFDEFSRWFWGHPGSCAPPVWWERRGFWPYVPRPQGLELDPGPAPRLVGGNAGVFGPMF